MNTDKPMANPTDAASALPPLAAPTGSPRSEPWSGKNTWKALVFPAALVITWQLLVLTGRTSRELLPAPATVLATLVHELTAPEFFVALKSSLGRTLSGLAIGLLGGFVLGVLLGGSRWLGRLGGPTFHAVRQVAPFAWIPLISAWFGVAEETKIVFIAIATLPPVAVSTIEGVRAVSPEHLELARTFEIRRYRLLRDVLIPSAAPHLFAGLHLGVITAWLATVGAEFFLQIAPGITNILIEGRALVRMDLVLAGAIIVGVIGFALSSVVHALEGYVLRWRPSRGHIESA